MKSYYTTDAQLAAVLSFAGYVLERTVDEIVGFRWYFSDPGDIADLARDFYAGVQGVSDSQKLLDVFSKDFSAPSVREERQERTGDTPYIVRDTQVASVLLHLGFKLKAAEQYGTKSVRFIFLDDGTADEIATRFYQDRLAINPKNFDKARNAVWSALRRAQQYGEDSACTST